MENQFNETIYYENWTTDGMEGERSSVHARWQTYKQALDAMQNYANSWLPKGTGWIVKVTIKTDNEGRVFVERDRIFERN